MSGPGSSPFIQTSIEYIYLQDFNHYLVYWIAPTVGAVLATVLFAVFQASFLSDDAAEKTKED